METPLQPADPWSIKVLLREDPDGSLYRGDTKRGSEVFVKVFDREIFDDTSWEERLEGDIKRIKSASTKNLLQIVDYGITEDRCFVVTQAPQGNFVREYIRGGYLQPESIRRMALDIVSGLKAVHRVSIFGIDLRPDTVLIDNEGTARLSLPAPRRPYFLELKTHFSLRGCFRYMAPEVWRDVQPNEKTDVYSLGVTLLEMITSIIPNAAEIILEGKEQIEEWEIEALGATPEISKQFRVLIEGMLAKSERDRPSLADVESVLRAMAEAV